MIEVYPKQTKGNGGHKHKLSLRDEMSIIRSLHYARKQDGNFTSKKIKLYSGFSSFHDRIAHRVLNKYEQHYRKARREGLLTENDCLKLRLIFVKDIKRYYDGGLWSSGICFYLNAEHIILKTNLMDQARLQNVWPEECKITALVRVVLQTEIKPGIVAKSLFFCCYMTWQRKFLL